MERDRVEMSVGDGMVNGGRTTNGVIVNGAVSSSKRSAEDTHVDSNHVPAQTNGAAQGHGSNYIGKVTGEEPPELLQMISTEFYLPMAKLVHRSAQMCWNDLTELVERLAKIHVPVQSGPVGMPGVPANNQTKANLEKKDAFLNFAKHHKDVFIKLLVLLEWSKNGEDVRKTIELNYWLVQRRAAYTNATIMLGQMLQDLAGAQVPNPDLYTAAEVLATGKVSTLPDLGYIDKPPLSPTQILRVLKRLNVVLCRKLTLDTEIPVQLKKFHVHDGRVSFFVQDEFELDLSLMGEDSQSNFLMVDLRFSFFPSPSIPDSLHDEISIITNSAIAKDGLQGAYDFVHDLTLSYKLNELHRQAQELAQGLWSGHLKVEMIKRTLVLEYWLKRPGSRSWFEIGIHSGRISDAHDLQTPNIPRLQLRWLREGKIVPGHHIIMDTTKLSVEKTLRHVISHHTNSLFDSVYDRLATSPLYADAELELAQSSSPEDPMDCSLEIQLSKSDNLHARIEPVSGSITLAPVSDKTSRMQKEMSRFKNFVEEFVSKVLHLRCAVAHARLSRTVRSSGWEALDGFKPLHTEMEALFSMSINRAAFFRQYYWSPAWMLAVTTSVYGDYWWLVQRIKDDSMSPPQMVTMLKSKPLHLESSISTSYMRNLADHTSGVVVLQSNLQYLDVKGVPYRLPTIPSFTKDSKLPSLNFMQSNDRELVDQNRHPHEAPPGVELSYRGLEQNSGKVVSIARANLRADSTVLTELAASHLDPSIAIFPDLHQVMVRSTSKAGMAIIEEVSTKLRHLNNTVACAATVKKSSYHMLQSLSLLALTVVYNTDPLHEFKLVIRFATSTKALDLEFLPAAENPHQYMVTHVMQMLNKKDQSLSKNLEEVLALLKMTQPLMAYLHQLQSQPLISASNRTNGISLSEILRVHVLPRQPATYAIQYFSKDENFTRDVSDSETPKKLLARFEILLVRRGTRNMWVIRPAIEEFESYTRPSFTSDSLRSKLKFDIFSRDSPTDWLPLDEGIACGPEHPERALSAIHGSILQWLGEALKPDVKPTQQTNGVNGLSHPGEPADHKAQQLKLKRPPVQRTADGQAWSNGTQMQGQRVQQNYHIPKNNPKVKQEVITLD